VLPIASSSSISSLPVLSSSTGFNTDEDAEQGCQFITINQAIITFPQLCENTGISRNTLWAHFS